MALHHYTDTHTHTHTHLEISKLSQETHAVSLSLVFLMSCLCPTCQRVQEYLSHRVDEGDAVLTVGCDVISQRRGTTWGSDLVSTFTWPLIPSEDCLGNKAGNREKSERSGRITQQECHRLHLI